MDAPQGAPAVTTDVDEAAAVLARGGLVAFPTETVYGLGADAADARAVLRIFAAKGRPADHPLIVHLARAEDLPAWAARVPDEALALAEALWPGPLTLLLPRGRGVADEVTGGRPTVGLRVPGHPVALALLEAVGRGIAAPSANRFGRVSPTTAAHVVADLGGAVDLVLDGGPCQVGIESTIVDLSGDEPVVLRPGGIDVARLEAILGRRVPRWSGEGPARAPGMLAAHYAPRATVVPVEAVDDLPAAAPALAGRLGVLAGEALPIEVVDLLGSVVELEPAGDADGYARVLYDRLRQADRLGLDALLVVLPPDVGIGTAVRDRVERAAAGAPAGDEGD